MRANFPLRLVGKVVSAADARVATGQSGTGAHLLCGRGDFLSVGGGNIPMRFQVAFISDRDVQQEMLALQHDLPVLVKAPGWGRIGTKR